MAVLGCRLLTIADPTQGKRLIVYVEIDRCMADAIAAVTGCRLGRRTLKYFDYGKCACTFVDTETGRFALHYSPLVDGRARKLRVIAAGCKPQDYDLARAKLRSESEITWGYQCVPG